MCKFKQIFALFLMTGLLATAHPLLAQQQPDAGGLNFSLQAVSSDGSSVVPYFVLDGTAGGQITGQVHIKNHGDSSGTVELYPVDAVTGQTGGTVLKMREDAFAGTGGWIVLERDVVTLAPGEGQMVPFVVNIPAGIRSGAHVGGIVMQPADNAVVVETVDDSEVSFQVDIKTRTGVAVQVNLPGVPVEQLDVLGIQLGGHDSRQIMYLNLRNSGSEMVKTTGSLRIMDAQGEQLQNIRFYIDTFLPENEIKYPVHIVGKALPAGTYTADLSLRYGESVQAYRNQMTFDISEADNVQIFEGSGALASPLTARSGEVVNGRSLWEKVTIGGLGLLIVVFVGYLGLSIYQYERERKLQKEKLVQQKLQNQRLMPQGRPVTGKRPLSNRSSTEAH
jgi:hypothetical protein